MPCSRRNVRLKAIALNVVAITLIPAMPGITMSSSSGSLANTDATSSSSVSGSTNEKNAALGLRQNSLRSRRNCSQARLPWRSSGIRGSSSAVSSR